MMDTPRFLVSGEVADLFRVKRKTVHRWRKLGVIEAARVGRGWLFPLAGIEAALARQGHQTDLYDQAEGTRG
jgi:excisionase family DNA binding protein